MVSKVKQIDILYFFHNEKCQKYFKSELNGKTNYIWEGFMETMKDTVSTSETLINFSDLDGKDEERRE